jgi:uncharacterized damage-inducible protein DinB
MRLDETIAILERTPTSLSALLNGLTDSLIRSTEGDNTWSPYDVLGHLVHGERADWMPRAHRILEGKMRTFEPFDRNAQFTESRGKSLRALLDSFAELRKENIQALRNLNLKEDDLSRKGMHPSLGEVTLGQLLATWVVHDLDHVAQVARTMAKAYGDATGPWQEYLSILRDRQK